MLDVELGRHLEQTMLFWNGFVYEYTLLEININFVHVCARLTHY